MQQRRRKKAMLRTCKTNEEKLMKLGGDTWTDWRDEESKENMNKRMKPGWKGGHKEEESRMEGKEKQSGS